MIKLEANERIDDLMTETGLKIIQSREVFSFSIDAVLLSKFVTVPKRGKIVDLCSGNGVIPMLLTTRTQAQIDAVEIQPRLADMARRSIAMNGLGGQVNIIEADLRNYMKEAGNGVYDVVSVNPPYMAAPDGDHNENEHYAIARHEIYCTLDDVIHASARLVRSGGKVAMVHRPSRFIDIMETMRKYRMEPKRVQFIHPNARGEANMVLIEAIRDGKPELRVLPPIMVYE
ncbi:tRNA1(Val) (adenine(37)-N6)-methyltransferase [Paenibacillus sp. NEAU-GSW1]|uniref:tRNA1(Val) (adenine(37)-N6)-methyltransferase n=1 Tax=Paenibacillus sp. NEAU-GSW1 TaxID=2682486 RepID=UPI0012E1F91D|nr:tRNA1(Val) (adenine(37)-N6)-methyltransferase [Paenibacillus sp. NEAU-GSW1]MUT67728.1 methyltransferase [Paenibacillus sp. NEAU-GSW1]